MPGPLSPRRSFAGLAVVILGHLGALLPAFAGLSAGMLCAEAFARGHMAQFIAGLFVTAVIVAAAWLVAWTALGHWRTSTAVLLIMAAGA